MLSQIQIAVGCRVWRVSIRGFLDPVVRVWVIGGLFVLPSSGWAKTLHNPTSQEERDAVLETARQIGAALPGLGYAYGELSDGTFTMAGSVLKLSDTIAVTAAHASQHWSEGEYVDVWIGFGNFQDGLDGKETTYKVSAIYRHPVFDLALYSLADNPVSGVPNAVIRKDILPVNQPIVIGGYGQYSHVSGPILGYGEKLGARGIISGDLPEEMPEHYQYCLFTGDTGLDDYHAEGGLVDTWDSGGGVYTEVDGEHRLVGIIEVKAGEREYGSYSGFLPLSHPGAYQFINQYLDSDGDGQSNFTEDALGSDGHVTNSFANTPLEIHSEGGGVRMILSHLALLDSTVVYKGQHSEDLSEWVDAQQVSNPSSLPTAPDGYSWLSWEVNSTSRMQFLRVLPEAQLNLIWE